MWIPEFVNSLDESFARAQSMNANKDFTRAIFIFSKIFDKLFFFPSAIDFNAINYNFHNDDYIKDRIKEMVEISIKKLLIYIERNDALSIKAQNLLDTFLGKNILFDKIYLDKLVHKKESIELYKTIIDKYILATNNEYKIDPDFHRMIGVQYLNIDNFEQSKSYLDESLKLCKDDIQMARVYFNFAKLIMGKIEMEQLKSYNSVAVIKKKLTEAENYILQANDIYLHFTNLPYKELDRMRKRLQLLKEKYF